MISITGLTKRFGSVTAVNGISAEIRDNEILGLLGPNGAGKTTTMRMLTGFLTPDEGTIAVDGVSAADAPMELQRMIGYLPENNPLYEDMNVFEYLSFVAAAREIAQPRRRIGEVADLCRIRDMLTRSIGELSKGYRQRVGFAAAILHDPKILILDEPTAGLDPNQAREVRQLINEFKKNKTIVLSTHILPEVEEVADRVVIINRGSIAAQGSIAELHSLTTRRGIVRFGGALPKDFAVRLPGLIPGIQSVELAGSEGDRVEYEIQTTTAEDIRPALFALAVKEGWTVTELHRVSASLEHIFRDLTIG